MFIPYFGLYSTGFEINFSYILEELSACGVKLNRKILSNIANEEGDEISLFLGADLASDGMNLSKNQL